MVGAIGAVHAIPGVWLRVCPFMSRFFLGSHGKEVMHVIVS